MARTVPHDDEHDEEPISPELAMIDPELARRHASTPPIWERMHAAQKAAREANERDDLTVGSVRRRRRRWPLFATAAVVAGAGALVPLTLDRFSEDSRNIAAPTSPAERTRVPTSAPGFTPPATVKGVAPLRPVFPALPATVEGSAPAHPITTGRAPAKPHVRQRVVKRHIARPPVLGLPATVKGTAPAAPTETSPPPAKPPAQPRRHSPSIPEAKTFVWKSVPGATGYTFGLYRGNRAVLIRRTPFARLTVPGTWRYRGKVERLAAGRYDWWVWFARGRQSSGIVVHSTIVVGG